MFVKAFEEMLFKRVPDVVYVGSTVCHFLNIWCESVQVLVYLFPICFCPYIRFPRDGFLVVWPGVYIRDYNCMV